MEIVLSRENLIPVHTRLTFAGEGVARLAKIDKTAPDENTFARVRGLAFHNGAIGVDVRAELLPDAPALARGFIGIVFRASEDGREFESFYIRPTNGRGCGDPVRRAHGCQYFSYPGYTFSYFREFGVEGYEASVETIALGEWSHIRAEVRDGSAEFFVNGERVLGVDGLKHGPEARGAVGLYVDIGTDGFFRHLRIEPWD